MATDAIDLLTPLLDNRRAGQVVLRQGRPNKGWQSYDGKRNAVLVADEDTTLEGDEQAGKVLHVRTGRHDSNGQPGVPHYGRLHTIRHFVHPTVYVSFRIEGWDDGGEGFRGVQNLGFKLGLSHQDSLTSYHLQFKLDGSVVLFKEARDGMEEAKHRLPGGGVRLVPDGDVEERWYPRIEAEQPVRHHLVAGVDEDSVFARIDNGPLFRWPDPFLIASGQISMRLDGVDVSLHSFMVS